MSRLALLLSAVALACGSAKTIAPAPKPTVAPSPAQPPAVASALPCPPAEATYEPRRTHDPEDGEAHLPGVVQLPTLSSETGGAYSIGGASHFLRTAVHTRDVSDQRITLQGYIVKTNLADAPRCAVHPPQRPDPPGCKAAVPAFWLGDTPRAAPADSIKVMGWASRYAEVYEAVRTFDAGTGSTRYVDSLWAVEVPNPLPSAGAHVKVSGTYSLAFTRSSIGFEVNTQMGLLTYDTIEVLEPAATLGTLPGMKRPRIVGPSQ